MKKIIAIVLALVMTTCAVLTMSSCSKEDDTLVCGVTIFEKMNEQNADGTWTGFESEFAMAVGEIIGMDVEFQEITWEQKYAELESGAIDCIWNGFTANSSDNGTPRKDLVDFSYGYMLNQQCIVVNKADLATYKSQADLAGKVACVEGGSAGEEYAKGVTDKEILKATNQLGAFMDLKAGGVDFIVVDVVLAQNLCGKDDFSDLAIVEAIELKSVVYAIGFKKGSELTAKVNAAIKQLDEDGTLAALAKKYGFENVVKVIEEITIKYIPQMLIYKNKNDKFRK